MSRTVLCTDHLCRHNSGSGYYGLCKHPIVNQPMYTGGIDRMYMSTCKLKETKDGKIIITGGARGCGKSNLVEAVKKILEEEQK